MTTDDIDQEQVEGGADDSEKEGKGGKGKGEQGSAGVVAREVQLTDGLLKYMQSIGASMKQITDILKNWGQLTGDGLARAVSEFSRDVTRASAHLIVQIDRNGGFTIPFDIVTLFAGHGSAGYVPKLGNTPRR